MRNFIIPAFAAAASLAAVNFATAAIKRLDSKVELHGLSFDDVDPSLPTTYLLYDGLPFEGTTSSIEMALDILLHFRELPIIMPSEDTAAFDVKATANTIVADILERVRLGEETKFQIIATGLFAQIALDVSHQISCSFIDAIDVGEMPELKLILFQPVMGWQQVVSAQEYNELKRHAARLRRKEILLGNLAFWKFGDNVPLAHESGMAQLAQNSVKRFAGMSFENLTIVYDSRGESCKEEAMDSFWADHFGDGRGFYDFAKYDRDTGDSFETDSDWRTLFRQSGLFSR